MVPSLVTEDVAFGHMQGGEGSGEVGNFSQVLPCWSFEGFPKTNLVFDLKDPVLFILAVSMPAVTPVVKSDLS